MALVRTRTGLAALWLLQSLWAARLPCKLYTQADGLPHNYTTGLLQDSRGLVWIGTEEGLARFDGERFRVYGLREGLPHQFITFIYETRDGALWVGTAQGVCRLLEKPEQGRLFRCWSPGTEGRGRAAMAMMENSRGELWLGTGAGAWRVVRTPDAPGEVHFEPFALPYEPWESRVEVRDFCEQPSGEMWAAGGGGLFRWRPGGRVDRFTRKEGLPQKEARCILCDSRGRVWAGLWDRGVVLLAPSPTPGRHAVDRIFRMWGTEVGNQAIDLVETSDGRILATTAKALTELEPAKKGRGWRVHRISKAQGLGSALLHRILEDREGNLWMTSSDAGVTKILRRGFVTFGVEDGIPNPDIGFLSDLEGIGLVCGRIGTIVWFDGVRFHAVRLNLPRELFADTIQLGWGWGQWTFRDHLGDWWIPTGRGIFRFGPQKRLADLASAELKARYTRKDGLASDEIFRMFEDSRGDIWISMLATDRPVAVWARKQGRFLSQEIRTDSGGRQVETASAFGEDRYGQIWAGFYDGGLARLRRGQWEHFGPAAGAPAGFVHALLFDRRGRLWVASADGLRRIDDPGAERPGFRRYGEAHGLPERSITALAEDRQGRIYLGMHSRVARLDPDELDKGGPIRLTHFSSSEGVPLGGIRTMLCDRTGAIWTAGVNGVARLEPEERQRALPWPVRFMALKAGGVALPLSELGERTLKGYSFPDHGGALEIEVATPGSPAGQAQHYYYRLESAKSAWSAPSPGGTLSLASLRPGRYRLFVHAGNSEADSEPALFEFTVTAPLYRQAWFLASAASAMGLGLVWVYRSRWKRALTVDRMRTQIAADLHDELGAHLTQLALNAEMARLSGSEEARSRALEQAAAAAREMIASLSDLVWTLRPRPDSAAELIQRMRSFAGEMAAAANMELDFAAACEEARLRLDHEQRRQVLAIFKEAIHNAVRHSRGSRVAVRMEVLHGDLMLHVRDNGTGMRGQAGSQSVRGQGIAGMQWRAQCLGGRLEIGTAREGGVEVTLRVPLRGQRKKGAPGSVRGADRSGESAA